MYATEDYSLMAVLARTEPSMHSAEARISKFTSFHKMALNKDKESLRGSKLRFSGQLQQWINTIVYTNKKYPLYGHFLGFLMLTTTYILG